MPSATKPSGLCGTGGNMFGTGPASHSDTLDGSQDFRRLRPHGLWAAGIDEITDGTANTICVGEVRPRDARGTSGTAGCTSTPTVGSRRPRRSITRPVPTSRGTIASFAVQPARRLGNGPRVQVAASRRRELPPLRRLDAILAGNNRLRRIYQMRLGDRRDGQTIGEYRRPSAVKDGVCEHV